MGTVDKKWYKIYKSNRKGDRRLVDEVRGEARAVHRVDILNGEMSPDEHEQGWSYYRATNGTSAPALEHAIARPKRHRPDMRRKRR